MTGHYGTILVLIASGLGMFLAGLLGLHWHGKRRRGLLWIILVFVAVVGFSLTVASMFAVSASP